MSEEERRRKIIIDSQVARAAARGIEMAVKGDLTGEEARALIALDEEYLSRCRGICPALFADSD